MSCINRAYQRLDSLPLVAQGSMAPRILGLLWELSVAPIPAPPEERTGPLVDALFHYACEDPVTSKLVWDYMTRCVAQARRSQ